MRMRCMLAVAVTLLLLSACGKKPSSPTATTTTADTIATTVAPTTPVAEFPRAGYINGDSVRVRKTPDTQNDSIGGVKFGDRVTLLGLVTQGADAPGSREEGSGNQFEQGGFPCSVFSEQTVDMSRLHL